MSSEGFQFKQFYVRHDRCAMKVGTDGVLLGAWTPVLDKWRMAEEGEMRILDVGTGSGLVALMLAQRFPKARIDAIDIDASAVEQAEENFASSSWSERLQTHLSHLQDWQQNNIPLLRGGVREGLYSLIVSNPPYFRNSLRNPDKGREMARHTDSLSYEELIRHCAQLLCNEGMMALILPAGAEKEICTLAMTEGLALTHLTRVYSKDTKPARRILIAFTKTPEIRNSGNPEIRNSGNPAISSLVLEKETGGRSAAYSKLCEDFYL